MNKTEFDRRAFIGVAGAATASLLLFARAGSAAPPLFRVKHTPEEWRRMLGAQRFEILRGAATERAFTSPLLREHRKGVFLCAGCAQRLFSSETKFESGTGWPSFWKPIGGAVVTRIDRSLLMQRTEVLCARCGGHLGHVFDDGPKPTGLRYCMNGLALTFQPS